MIDLAGLGRVGRSLFLVALFPHASILSARPAATSMDGTVPAERARNCLITLPGDVNNSGSVTTGDVIHLVNYIFKGGTYPLPCVAAGDVNCSGSITNADNITLIHYVLKSGMPPCDICNRSSLGPSCT